MDRHFRTWVVASIVLGAPTFFALPYLVPETFSRFERGLVFAGVSVVVSLVSEVIARVLVRRES
jgi:hypothetical protein